MGSSPNADRNSISEQIIVQLDTDMQRQIEDALDHWDDPSSDQSHRLEEALRKWDPMIQPLMDAVVATERLTEDDLAIRINTRA